MNRVDRHRWSLVRTVWSAVAVGGAVVAALAPTPAAEIERIFSSRLYPPIQRALTSLTNVLPFTILDVMTVAVLASVVFAISRAVSVAKAHRAPGVVAGAVFALATGVATAYLLFLAVWGLNYRRIPVRDRLELSQGVATAEPVRKLGLESVQRLNALYAEAHAQGWSTPEWQRASLVSAAGQVQTELTGVAGAVPGRLKASILGQWFRWNGIDGMVNPFGLEVIVNPDLLAFERAFVAAHEWAHLAGFAAESEANFVGFLTCMRAAVPEQYSGWLYLYWQLAAEVDSPTRAELRAAMQPGPRSDVDAIIARLRSGELPRLRMASWRVYDSYLKANRVESGVRSYGEVVNLLVRAEFTDGWVPRLKKTTQTQTTAQGR